MSIINCIIKESSDIFIDSPEVQAELKSIVSALAAVDSAVSPIKQGCVTEWVWDE